MKNTRQLSLVFLAAGVVLLLSSCSAMLDDIYPARQIISVDVQVNVSTHSDYTSQSSLAYVELTDRHGYPLGSPVAATYTNVSNGYANYYFTFTNLNSRTYGLYSYYSGVSTGTAYPVGGSPYGYWFSDPSGLLTLTVSVPYNTSSDITNLTVVIN